MIAILKIAIKLKGYEVIKAQSKSSSDQPLASRIEPNAREENTSAWNARKSAGKLLVDVNAYTSLQGDKIIIDQCSALGK